MRAVAWLVASALLVGGCTNRATPVDLSSLRTPIAPSPTSEPAPSPAPPAPSPNPPTYSVRLFVVTLSSHCEGCLAEIISGPGKGASGTTVDGQVTLQIPESGPVTVRISKDKYRPATTNLFVDGPNSRGQIVTLEAAVPTVDFSGPRLLEVRADAACNRLPEALRVRTYAVSFVKSGPGRFSAEPTDEIFSSFVVDIFGLVDEASILIEEPDSGQPGIIERLPDGGTLRMDIWADLPVASVDAISVPLEGKVSFCEVSGRCTVCDSKAHQLTLTRR